MAAVACVGAIRLVPFGLGLAPALLVTGLIVDRCLALEARILASPSGLDAEERTAVLVTTLIVAFLGFVGVAATVPGGLAQPGTERRRRARRCRNGTCSSSPRATRSSRSCSATGRRRCGLSIAARRAVVRGDVRGRHRHRRRRRAVHGDPAPARPGALTLDVLPVGRVPRRDPARRRDARWLWQTLLLAVLGLVVIGLNLLLRE